MERTTDAHPRKISDNGIGIIRSSVKLEMNDEITIRSYFSLPTDLAEEMAEWPEFIGGKEYAVDLRDTGTGEGVIVRLIESKEERPYISIKGRRKSSLFDKVVGRVIWALSQNSDDLIVDSIKMKTEPAH